MNIHVYTMYKKVYLYKESTGKFYIGVQIPLFIITITLLPLTLSLPLPGSIIYTILIHGEFMRCASQVSPPIYQVEAERSVRRLCHPDQIRTA